MKKLSFFLLICFLIFPVLFADDEIEIDMEIEIPEIEIAEMDMVFWKMSSATLKKRKEVYKNADSKLVS
jgi:hypothetical protein